ncbi:hypothetical protein C4577_02430 [Candidatus Parcubacteria bacterium]|nr:MAG: hypothetical protein C4577_02430 [Candidatus Parcubacteria bacterium]
MELRPGWNYPLDSIPVEGFAFDRLEFIDGAPGKGFPDPGAPNPGSSAVEVWMRFNLLLQRPSVTRILSEFSAAFEYISLPRQCL